MDGGYFEWGFYGMCLKMCGGGKKICEWICINLFLINGGKDCSSFGFSILSKEC